jgi:methyl-CpG-binding domain protein 4
VRREQLRAERSARDARRRAAATPPPPGAPAPLAERLRHHLGADAGAVGAKRRRLSGDAGEEARKEKFRRSAAPAASVPAPPAPDAPPSDDEMRDATPAPSSSGVASPSPGGGSVEMGDATAARKRPFLDALLAETAARGAARSAGAPPHAGLLASSGAKRRRTSCSGAAAASPPRSAAAADSADPRVTTWTPPVSPYGLLEEELFEDPWRVLVACVLLNKTTAVQARRVVWELFARFPTAATAAAADATELEALEALLRPLGLFRKRAAGLVRLSKEYLETNWRDPEDLYGIGEYAADAYWIFARGRWRGARPADKDLRRYVEWLEATGGLGQGLERCAAPASVAVE